MNRKDFLKILGIGAVSAPLIPILLKSIPSDLSDVHTVNSKTTHTPIDEDLTKGLYEFMQRNPSRVRFKYKFEPLPTFLVDGTAYAAQMYKLKHRYCPEIAQDLNAYHGLDTERDVKEILYGQVVNELNDAYHHVDTANPYDVTFHIYQLIPTQTFYNPEDFSPRRELLIRYAKVRKK